MGAFHRRDARQARARGELTKPRMETPNPYKPPEAPVDRAGDVPPPGAARGVLRILVVAQLALVPIAVMLPDTLPAELRPLRDESDMAFFDAHGALAIAAIAVLVASLVGLWREQRWGAWAYLVANAIGYVLQFASGPHITSDLAALVDSFADAAVGATFLALYFGGYFSQPRTLPPG